MSKKSDADRIEAINRLREWGLKPGDTIYVTNRHTSASGMTRSLSLYKLENNQPIWLSYLAAKAGVGRWNDRRETVDVQGAGMDMGFQAVYTLSSLLFPNGFGCIGEGCPAADHSNGDRDYTPHYDGTPRDSSEVGKDLKPYPHYHKTCGGYALKHRWLA